MTYRFETRKQTRERLGQEARRRWAKRLDAAGLAIVLGSFAVLMGTVVAVVVRNWPTGGHFAVRP